MTNVNFAKNIEKILENIDYSKLGKKVAIKVHFGEKGCDTYINPELVRKVYKKIESLGKEATLIECNVLYKGSRTTTTDHLKTAIDHGFTDMNIDILDGEKGEEFIEIDGCKIGAGLKRHDSIIVLSHFKGHGATGFGGAIKNVGMGLGSRAGKLHMHAQVLPKIISEKCIGCGICVENCNANAITITNNVAKIDQEKCEGCAMCIAVCPHKAASVEWQSGIDRELQKRISQYAKAVMSLFPNPIFINVLEKITEQCDCMGAKQVPMMNDVGIVSSDNIVAIDKASLDLVNKFSDGKFENINKIDKERQIKLTEKLNLGTSEYKLIEL